MNSWPPFMNRRLSGLPSCRPFMARIGWLGAGVWAAWSPYVSFMKTPSLPCIGEACLSGLPSELHLPVLPTSKHVNRTTGTHRMDGIGNLCILALSSPPASVTIHYDSQWATHMVTGKFKAKRHKALVRPAKKIHHALMQHVKI